MQLSNRLLAVASMVTPGHVLADVGTDHGYVPIYLAEQNRIREAIAMDINEGPLQRAKEHIHAHQLTDRIQTRRSDGLEAMKCGEADSILIAGMGGALTIYILSEGADKIADDCELILAPQSEIRSVRFYLQEEGYRILEENMIFEDGKYYPIMKAVRGDSNMNEMQLNFGPCLLEQKHPVLLAFLKRETGKNRELCRNLENRSTEHTKKRTLELMAEIELMEAAIHSMES